MAEPWQGWEGAQALKRCSLGKAIFRGKMRWIHLKAIFSVEKKKQR